MVFSVELEKEEWQYIETYTRKIGMTIPEFLKMAALERIEDEYDRKAYERAMEEFQKNPVTYSMDEVVKMLED